MILCDDRNSTSTTYVRDRNSTATYNMDSYNCFYATTYTSRAELTKDERAEMAKAEAEEKRIRHMRELWKLERKFNRNRNGMRKIV